ncbi:MAG: porin family protein [Vicingaceae bacterium]
MILFCLNRAQGQTFKPGVIMGITTSQVGGDNYSGFNKLGVTFGGFVRLKLNENWSTQFEIYYIQKGSRNGFSITENDPNQASQFFLMRFNYVEIPLLFRFNFHKFVYEIGPYYSQLIGLHYEIRNDQYGSVGPIKNVDDLNQRYNFQYPMKENDFGFILGVNYKINAKLLGSIRYGQGVTSLKRPESGIIDPYPTSLNIGWVNTVLTGTLRYTFGEGDDL